MNTTTRHSPLRNHAGALRAFLSLCDATNVVADHASVTSTGLITVAVNDPEHRASLAAFGATVLSRDTYMHGPVLNEAITLDWGSGTRVRVYGPLRHFVVVDSDTGERLTEPLSRQDAADVASLSPSRRVHVEAVA